MLKLIASLASLISILEQSFAVILLTMIFFIFIIISKEKVNLSEERNVNFLALSTFLSFMSFFLPKGTIFAAIFTSLAHNFRGGVFRNLFIYTALSYPFLYYYYDVNSALFISLAGAIAASLVESVQSKVDKHFTVLLTLATTYVIFTIYIPETSIFDLTLALAISLILSYLAMKVKIADESGLLAATLCGLVVILFSDFKHFIVLLLFFTLGSLVTKYKYNLKLQLGIAEQAGGARGYANVLGNSMPALFFAMNTSYGEFFSAAFVASVACALADTMASEIGKTAKKVYLITNFKRVEPGTSGGISVIGEFAALLGCTITFSLALFLDIIYFDLFIILAAFVGVHIDSLLGATLEKKDLLTNSAVNLISTLSAGLIYLILYFIF